MRCRAALRFIGGTIGAALIATAATLAGCTVVLLLGVAGLCVGAEEAWKRRDE